MSTTKKIGGHVLGYSMTAGGILLAILGGTVIIKMLSSRDDDKEALVGAIAYFAIGTFGIYAGSLMADVVNDENK